MTHKIKYAREQLGLTQAEFGKLVGVSKQAVCDWEKGRRTPRPANLKTIAKNTGLSIDYLLGDEDPPS